MKKSLFVKSLVAAMVLSFCACQKNDPNNDKRMEVSIAKKAEFVVTAGGHTLANTMKTTKGTEPEAGELHFFKQSACPDLYKANFPNQKLFKPECDHVYACIKEDAASQTNGNGALYEVEKSSFTYTAFYIVNAYSSKDHDAKGGHSDVAGDMHDLGINGVKITEFNTNTCIAADLILAGDGLQDVTYDDSFGVKKGNYTVSDWKLYSIPGYGYYVGMNYGSNKFGVEPDDDYSDWVIKVIPAVKSEEHVDTTNGSVEVNLSVNTEKEVGDYIATKLSIHVRALTDVEVFIPVDKMYYCLADDMDISLSHREKNIVYNTDPQYVDMKIGGVDVSFMVQYEDEGIRVMTDGINEAVINYCAEQYADGITFEVWNYFKDITRAELKPMLDAATVTFLDHEPVFYVNAFNKLNNYGADFKIYTAFNEEGQLVPYTDSDCTMMLDQQYWARVNADDKDLVFLGVINEWDCTVTPVSDAYTKSEKDVTDPTLPNYNVEYNR